MKIFSKRESQNIIEHLKDQIGYYASIQANSNAKLDLIMIAVPELQFKLGKALKEILEPYTEPENEDSQTAKLCGMRNK